jgi:hypothetical protein
MCHPGAAMEKQEAVDEDLKILDAKINQLKREYEQYFLGPARGSRCCWREKCARRWPV